MDRAKDRERPFSRIYETLPGAYFREAAQSFDRAAQQAGLSHDLIIRIADIPFRFRFAGDTAARLILPALSHLVVEDTEEAVWTIHCWDDATTDSAMPLPTGEMRVNHQRNCLRKVSDLRYRAFYQEWMETLSFIDREGTAYVCYLEADQLPMYERTAPLRQVLNTALNTHGKQIVHAASIGGAHGSLLLAGPPRSGKSTLAVQGLLSGMGFQSDDLCVLSQDDPPRSWCLYNTAKLRDDALARISPEFPLQSFTEGPETKHFFHVHHAFPDRILSSAPVRALIIPEISGESSSSLQPATRLEALRALIPWSVSEVPTSDNLGEKIMLKALRHLPAYRLRLGSDSQQTLTLLRTLIGES